MLIFIATHAETKTGNCKDLLEGYLAGRLSSEAGGTQVEALRREFKTSQEKALGELKEKLKADINTMKGRIVISLYPPKKTQDFIIKYLFFT